MNRKVQQLYITITAVVAVIILLTVFVFYSKDTKMKKFAHKRDGFSMLYPADWKKFENKDGTSVMFLAEKDNAMDIFHENVNIVVQDLSQSPLDLKVYSEMAVKQMKLVFEDNLEVLDVGEATLSGRQAFKFVYKGKMNTINANIYGYHYWTIKDNIAYQFTYMSLEEESKDPYFGFAKRMQKSFKITR